VADRRDLDRAAGALLLIVALALLTVSCARRAVPADESDAAGPIDTAGAVGVVTPATPATIDNDPIDAAYRELDAIRENRIRQLGDYLERIEASADAAGRDEALGALFLLRLRYHELERDSGPTPDAADTLRLIAESTLALAVNDYRSFHDILFVDRDGVVFHTVFRNDQLGRNLTEGELAGTPLARRLREASAESFVLFDDGETASEPSAWFVEPVQGDAGYEGSIVMQCLMQRINDIFTREEYLGRTGETFLVDGDSRMLTASRFSREPTILGLHLSPANIEAKFAERSGRKLVIDYRGYRALTSFEVIEMLDSEWLVVAKIDEAEIITDYYRANHERLAGELLDALSRNCVAAASDCTCEADDIFDSPPSGPMVAVDMDEFRRVGPDEIIRTAGVSTCTAVTLYIPRRFAYLGHAGSYDSMYGGADLDIVGNMAKRVRNYEIPPFERREVRAEVIATHSNSILGAVDRLIEEGFFLTQIRFIYHSGAASAAVLHDTASGITCVQWLDGDRRSIGITKSIDPSANVGEAARRLWIPAG
jgi:hypothetical protein